MIAFRTVSILSKFHRLSSTVWSLSSTIEYTARYKHNSTSGNNNPRSGRRESGNTHHGRFETGTNVDIGMEKDVESESLNILDDK